jgi:hypothetical protein
VEFSTQFGLSNDNSSEISSKIHSSNSHLGFDSGAKMATVFVSAGEEVDVDLRKTL